MTNLEWLLSLPVEDIEKRYHSEECTLCIYDDSGECDNRSCLEGKLKWLNAEHTPKVKPCPVCNGKMDIRWQHSGCYLVCAGCGLHYGLNADIADAGIVEGGYRKEEALIDDWNTRLEEGENND